MPRLRNLAAFSVATAAAWVFVPATAVEAQDAFNPYAEVEKAKVPKLKASPPAANGDQPFLAPTDGVSKKPGVQAPANTGSPTAPSNDTVMRQANPPPVQRDELAPVMASDGWGLPFELWRGLTVEGVEKLMGELELPPRSLALHNLWKRLLISDVTPPAGETTNVKFAALRLEAMYLSGLSKEASDELKKQPLTTDSVMATLAARVELANDHAQQACELARQAATIKGEIPKSLKSLAIMMSGYCAGVAKDAASAGLAAELAREEGVETSPSLEALDAISVAAKPKIATAKRVTLIDYRLLQLAGSQNPAASWIDKAEPALLAALANDAGSEPALKLAAAEAAARINAVAPEELAQTYRAQAATESADALLAGGPETGPARRAALFKAAETEKTPMKKTRLIRAFIDDAKRAGLAMHALQMIESATASLNPQPEIGWFAETAAEIGLASGKTGLTRRWVALGLDKTTGSGLDHWLALADIAEPGTGTSDQYLKDVETLALRGRFTPDALHRLATVLDALNYVVPIPLWEAASRTPQPTTGHLPATGVLSELQDASKKKEFGHTVLLAMKTLGPNGAEGANIIALGDSMRALKRAGLEVEARRLGLQALLVAWPRTLAN